MTEMGQQRGKTPFGTSSVEPTSARAVVNEMLDAGRSMT